MEVTLERLESRRLLAAGDVVRSFCRGGVLAMDKLGPASELLIQKNCKFLVSSGD